MRPIELSPLTIRMVSNALIPPARDLCCHTNPRVLKGVQSPEAKPREIVPLSERGDLCDSTNPKQEGVKVLLTILIVNGDNSIGRILLKCLYWPYRKCQSEVVTRKFP